MKYRLQVALTATMMFGLAACVQKAPVRHPDAGPKAPSQTVSADGPLQYTIDVTDRADDLFKVTLQVDDLDETAGLYQFASTAPGTYQTMNIGRFVRSFEAFDADGNALSCTRESTNQWRISEPRAVRRIAYTIADIWDTPVKEQPVYPMASTSLEEDYAHIMPHAVLGYPTGMQHRPLTIALKCPSDWTVGTALAHDATGAFLADSYDHAVDSPILAGKLTYASMDFHGGLVAFYAYSKSGDTTAEMLLEETRDVIESVGAFLNGFPVDRYTFLFLLDDNGSGAWEHSYSSNYTIPDQGMRMMMPMLDGITAHEIFHIVTPLNIHSEIIETFNFVEPVPSRHLWLYEATTEWAAMLMRLRSGALSLDGFFDKMREKMTVDGFMNKDLSLVDLAMTSFTPTGAQQYPNIYMRGAVTVALLDIRLLELSGGKRGMREVLLELADTYGKERAFDEAAFFETFAQMTYPEIRDFFTRFVEGHEPLPVAAYFDKLGITYSSGAEDLPPMRWMGFMPTPEGEHVVVHNAEETVTAAGLKNNDRLLEMDGIAFGMDQLAAITDHIKEVEIGAAYTLKVQRGEETLDLTLTMGSRKPVGKHQFSLNPEAGPEQVALREAWLKNLPR